MLIRFSRKFRDDTQRIYRIDFERSENSDGCLFQQGYDIEDNIDPKIRKYNSVNRIEETLPTVDKASRNYINGFPDNNSMRIPFDSMFNTSDSKFLDLITVVGISSAFSHCFIPYSGVPFRDSKFISSNIGSNLIGKNIPDWAMTGRHIYFPSQDFINKYISPLEDLFGYGYIGKIEYGQNESSLSTAFWIDSADLDPVHACSDSIYKKLCDSF